MPRCRVRLRPWPRVPEVLELGGLMDFFVDLLLGALVLVRRWRRLWT